MSERAPAPRPNLFPPFAALALLLFGGGALIVSLMLERQAGELSRRGVEALARIEQLVQHGSGTGKGYRVILALPDPAVPPISLSMSPEAYQAVKVGDILTVTHLPGLPGTAMLGDIETQRAVVARAHTAQIIGGALLLPGVLLGVSAWRTHAGLRG